MITSSLDLSIAIGAFLVMPLIIWVNLYNHQSGLMAYLWRESPWLVRIGLTFLAFTWLSTTAELAAYYGVVSADTAKHATTVLGIPMLVLSLTVVTMGTLVLVRYLKSRRSD